jgi:hypothetical protein
LGGVGFLVEGGRSKDVALKPENFAVHNLRMEDVVALLKSANGSHKCGRSLTRPQELPQD